MKKNFLFTIFFTLVLSYSLLTAQEPFASVVDVPENPKNDANLALAISFIKDVRVPDQDVVGVPAYPDAKIFQTTKAQAGMLPTVRLLSTDKITEVVKFYKKELSDWKHKDMYGIQMFFQGEEQKAMFGQEPVVQIESADAFTHILSSAKSTITIGYGQPVEEDKEE